MTPAEAERFAKLERRIETLLIAQTEGNKVLCSMLDREDDRIELLREMLDALRGPSRTRGHQRQVTGRAQHLHAVSEE